MKTNHTPGTYRERQAIEVIRQRPYRADETPYRVKNQR